MKQLILIVGLPGSGKTKLARDMSFYGVTLFDDISVNTDYEKIDRVKDEDYIVVTDPTAILYPKEKVFSKLREWFGERDLAVFAFENDPDSCWKNIQGRDDRIISQSFIEQLSKNYIPEDWGRVIPVWRFLK